MRHKNQRAACERNESHLAAEKKGKKKKHPLECLTTRNQIGQPRKITVDDTNIMTAVKKNPKQQPMTSPTDGRGRVRGRVKVSLTIFVDFKAGT